MKNKEYILIVEEISSLPKQVCNLSSSTPYRRVHCTTNLEEVKQCKREMEDKFPNAVYNIYEITKVER